MGFSLGSSELPVHEAMKKFKFFDLALLAALSFTLGLAFGRFVAFQQIRSFILKAINTDKDFSYFGITSRGRYYLLSSIEGLLWSHAGGLILFLALVFFLLILGRQLRKP